MTQTCKEFTVLTEHWLSITTFAESKYTGWNGVAVRCQFHSNDLNCLPSNSPISEHLATSLETNRTKAATTEICFQFPVMFQLYVKICDLVLVLAGNDHESLMWNIMGTREMFSAGNWYVCWCVVGRDSMVNGESGGKIFTTVSLTRTLGNSVTRLTITLYPVPLLICEATQHSLNPQQNLIAVFLLVIWRFLPVRAVSVVYVSQSIFPSLLLSPLSLLSVHPYLSSRLWAFSWFSAPSPDFLSAWICSPLPFFCVCLLSALHSL